MYAAKVRADSIAWDVRLTSIEATFPRYILAEINTHRDFSRNSASSRAIPVPVRSKQVREAPFVPEFTKNRRGMSAVDVLLGQDALKAASIWHDAAKHAADEAEALDKLTVHKQQANRLLEPFVWHTALITATNWDNFWNLRIHNHASPEIQQVATLMREAMEASTPRPLSVGQWHLPYVDGPECCEVQLYDATQHAETCKGPMTAIKISVARAAALSYDRHNATKTVDEYIARHDDLCVSGHWSPFEHQAKVASDEEILRYGYFTVDFEASNAVRLGNGKFSIMNAVVKPERIGNLAVPWLQYRKMFAGEAVFGSHK